MLRIAAQYARAVQARFSTTGHLFEQRYHALLVDADEYLLELVRYIHLNPVRAPVTQTFSFDAAFRVDSWYTPMYVHRPW